MSVGSVSSATSSSASLTTLDPKDLNKDGKVTQDEILQYNLTHPQSDSAKAAETKSNNLLDVTV